MPRRSKEDSMVWSATLRLPDEAGAAVDAMAEEMGVERAVATRIIVMQWYRQQQQQHEQQGGAGDAAGGSSPSKGSSSK